MPVSLVAAREAGGWKLSNVTRKTIGDVAVLTKKRPKVLNAVDTTVLAELESRSFGECIETEDMWIGLESFMSKGASAKARFVHR